MINSMLSDNFNKDEFKMSGPIWKYYQQKSGKNTAYFPIPEFSTPWGIADLVLLNLKIEEINNRIDENLTKPIISRLGTLVMNSLKYNRLTSIERLSISCAKKSTYLKAHILNFLLTEGYILEPNHNHYIKNSKYTSIANNIIAIEFKKENYKRAIYQAQRYKLFANQVYVALPSVKVDKLQDRLNMFRDKEIGLIAVNNNSAKVIINPPKKNPLSDAIAMQCEEKGFRLLLEQKEKKSTLATYKIKPSLKMNTARLSFQLNQTLIF